MEVLGLRFKEYETREERINAMISKIINATDDDNIENLAETIGAESEEVSQIFSDSARELRERVLSKAPDIPKKGDKRRISKSQEDSFVKEIAMVFNPTETIKTAISQGDVETIKKFQEYYPEVAANYANAILDKTVKDGVSLDKLTNRQGRIVNALTGGMFITDRQYITPTTQAIFSALRSKDQQQQAQGGQPVGRPNSFKSLDSQKVMNPIDKIVEKG
jgi:hypothetical protein